MKYEIKIEIKDDDKLHEVIKESYFQEDSHGKLIGKRSKITIKNDDPLFIVFRGLNNLTSKIINDSIIDGSMRCVVDEYETHIDLYPINNYCIIEDGKYSFY